MQAPHRKGHGCPGHGSNPTWPSRHHSATVHPQKLSDLKISDPVWAEVLFLLHTATCDLLQLCELSGKTNKQKKNLTQIHLLHISLQCEHKPETDSEICDQTTRAQSIDPLLTSSRGQPCLQSPAHLHLRRCATAFIQSASGWLGRYVLRLVNKTVSTGLEDILFTDEKTAVMFICWTKNNPWTKKLHVELEKRMIDF